ncbi:hypothetical protein [Dethiobacter alkaliphilus]|uniref:Uncharacterized protein n=1 Tax=Dethiobacter alkaliphilus AHT 1 TaxID=555088 RepID=C0GIX5_DETAL|nr:hypothetical protein [Dethiobacter alkaliphilus]EEG76789.1 conserved hypothetical protein [Dethiobacter alkaliphilus AHT 1]MCW3490826.1 hypothetical protein [Dethiobacter alkaliphilus]
MTALMFILFLLALSLLLRVQNKKRLTQEVPEHAKPSPFSQALQDLIATAGGIYLSLVLLVSFLQMDVADKWNIYGIKMEPLAFLALLFSVVQPLLLQVMDKIKGGS